VRATWDAHAQAYDVVLEDVATRVCRSVRARVVLGALGGFQSPRLPGPEELRDIEAFEGERWHSAEWRHDVPLAGKRVGVIGNGCSA
jgi:cation diffusion facilitator CzcD-associated flavoprotein CzcO